MSKPPETAVMKIQSNGQLLRLSNAEVGWKNKITLKKNLTYLMTFFDAELMEVFKYDVINYRTK